jgi:hypothetical protein
MVEEGHESRGVSLESHRVKKIEFSMGHPKTLVNFLSLKEGEGFFEKRGFKEGSFKNVMNEV